MPQFLFKELLEKFYKENKLISYIGYESNKKHLENIANIRITLNRNQLTNLKKGDIILFCKLKYRLFNPQDKSSKNFQDNISADDYEYGIIYVDDIYPDEIYTIDFEFLNK